jgi:hypothetical protein
MHSKKDLVRDLWQTKIVIKKVKVGHVSIIEASRAVEHDQNWKRGQIMTKTWNGWMFLYYFGNFLFHQSCLIIIKMCGLNTTNYFCTFCHLIIVLLCIHHKFTVTFNILFFLHSIYNYFYYLSNLTKHIRSMHHHWYKPAPTKNHRRHLCSY